MVTTRKKVKVVGTENYIKQDTGEIKQMQVIDIEERDFNFHKVWLEHILNSIDLIGNQKTRLAFWIVNHLNRENQLIMTQRKIAESTNMSAQTVNSTLKALIQSNFLIKINSGAYQVNPDVVFKGGKTDRANILLSYRSALAETQEDQNDEPHCEDDEPTLFDIGGDDGKIA
jgi:DNA-binding transcriptional regulator YhcF (GntR family)